MSRLKYLMYSLLFIALVLGGFAVYYRFAPFYLPRPTGPYAAATWQMFHWVDSKRQEKRVHDPAHPHRELMVRVWMPCEKPRKMTWFQKRLTEVGLFTPPPAPSDPVTEYSSSVLDFWRKAEGPKIGLSRPVYAYLMYWCGWCNGICKAFFDEYPKPACPASSGKPLPVIVFSHGFGVPVDMYTAYCTELASHGYVVFCISHTYDCPLVDFPDGRTTGMMQDPKAMSYEALRAFVDENIDTWIADTSFVLDKITEESQAPSSIFYQKLDLAHVGVFGHSFGGATAVQCCRRDKRFVAGCSLDGPLYGAGRLDAFDKPFLFIHSQENMLKQALKDIRAICKPAECAEAEKWTRDRWLGVNDLAMKIGRDAYNIDIPHVYHSDFSDIALLEHMTLADSWIFNFFRKDYVDGFALTKKINSYLVAFFDKYLKGDKQSVLLEPFRAVKK